MIYLKKQINEGSVKTVVFVTFFISLALSLSQVVMDPIIDSDAIFYLSLAKQIQSGNFETASQQYNWLLFPFLLSYISNITSLTLENSAYIINALLTAITCSMFILICKEFGGKKSAYLWISSLVILCFPNLNEYRNMIMRDHGYWAFYLLSCYFFIQAYKQPCIRNIAPLIITTALATLFRVEGVFFLLTLPVITLLHKQNIFKKPIVFIILITTVTLISWFAYINPDLINGFSKIEQITQLAGGFSNKIISAIDITEIYINSLSPQGFSDDYAKRILALSFLLILATEIFSAISPLYTLALIISWGEKINFPSNQLFRPWCYLIFLNIFILSGFLASKYFLAGRYPIALALTFLIPVPYSIHFIYTQHLSGQLSTLQTKGVKILTVLFIVLSIDGLVSTGPSKNYLKEAGVWITENNHPPIKVFTNHELVSFYANINDGKRIKELGFDILIKKIRDGKLQHFELFAIQISRKNTAEKTAIIKALNSMPKKIFENNRGDSVYIFDTFEDMNHQ